MEYTFVIAVLLTFAVLTGWIANRKGRSFVGWAVVGLFFHLLGMLLVALLPSKRRPALEDAGVPEAV